jgi:hypothetical protein
MPNLPLRGETAAQPSRDADTDDDHVDPAVSVEQHASIMLGVSAPNWSSDLPNA